MTLPYQRTRAIERTREFLRDLLDPKKTPKVPRTIREQAYWCLRHYPWEFHMDQATKALPDVFGRIYNQDLEPLPYLPFEKIDGEGFLDAPEPNEKLKKLMKEGD